MCLVRWILIIALSSQVLSTQGLDLGTFNEPGIISFNLTFNDTDVVDETINVSIESSSTAANGTDFIIPSTIYIGENDTSPLLVNITVLNDNIIEDNEVATISFSPANDFLVAPQNVTFTISSSDGPLTVSVNSTANAMENQTLSLCADASTEDHELSFNVTAMASKSFVTNSPQTVSFNPGDTQKCLLLTVVGDNTPQGERTFDVTWSATGNVNLSSSITTVTISSQLVLSLANGTEVTVSESSSFVSICVNSNGEVGPSPVTVDYNTTLINASNSDFSVSGTQLSIPADEQMACIMISITDNNVLEYSKQFSVTFSSPTGASLSQPDTTTVTIIDDDNVTISFENSSYTISEGVGVFEPILKHDGNFKVDFYVSITENGLSPQIGAFAQNYSRVTWTTSSAPSVQVNISNDMTVGLDRDFTLILKPLTMLNNIKPSVTTSIVTVVDDDAAVISVPERIEVSEESTSVMLCVNTTLNIMIPNYGVSYSTVQGTATAGNDYTEANGVIYLNSVRMNCTTIALNDDGTVEGNEYFTVSWSLPSNINQVTLERTETTVTIVENDRTSSSPTPPTTSFSSASSPTATPTTTPTEPPTSSFPLSTVAIVGIIVGVVVLGLLLLLILVCVIVFVKVKSNRQGFYTTHEDKEETPQMLRYSASLRSLQSQTVMPLDPREKENEYMI